jgi:ABC-2 type transport system ATP-binding protein
VNHAAVEATGLVREFKGGVRAVAGVSLSVPTGQIYGFLGPNGAGKSTIVRILTTLLAPTAGSARVGGHDVVTEADAVRRTIGVALQDAAIDPFMTGRELLQLQGVLHGLSRSDTRARGERLLNRVELVDAADRRVGTYSGGMRRRLDLALALIHEPQVLFLDEPTTGLDPISRHTLWAEVRRLNREAGTTVFLTTQYLEEADELASRVAIIAEGQIVADGTPTDLKAEIGQPTLSITVAHEQLDDARDAMSRFGAPAPTGDAGLAIPLQAGAAGVADVVRALDDAGVVATGLDLSEPSLDDVFMAKTGKRMEADEVTTT